MDLKKIALSLCAMGLTGVAFAGGDISAPECATASVTAPCEHRGWDLGFTGYWGRISSEHMVMDGRTGPGDTVPSFISVHPDYRFGYSVEGSYHWGNGNDAALEWTHYKKTFEETEVFQTRTVANASIGDTGVNKAHFKFDTLNFELGQMVNAGSKWDMRTHVGLQYLHLNRLLDYTVFFAVEPGSFATLLSDSHFKGAGPRIGLDGAYHLTNNFSLIGDAAVSVLAGKLEFLESTIFSTSQLSGTVITASSNNNVLVAGLDGRFGAQYDVHTASGVVSLSAGYNGSLYMNPTTQVPFTSGDDGLVEETTGHFGIGSFFVKVKYTS